MRSLRFSLLVRQARVALAFSFRKSVAPFSSTNSLYNRVPGNSAIFEATVNHREEIARVVNIEEVLSSDDEAEELILSLCRKSEESFALHSANVATRNYAGATREELDQRLAHDSQDADAQFEKAHRILRGIKGEEQDEFESFRLFEQSAKLGHPVSRYFILRRIEKHQEAFQILKEHANLNTLHSDSNSNPNPNPSSTQRITNPHTSTSSSVAASSNVNSVASSSTRSVEGINHVALFELGELFQEGEHVIRDEIEAFKYFQRSAGLGNDLALLKIYECYSNGTGVDRDENKALANLFAAYDNGVVEANFHLALLYTNGSSSIRRDFERAIELLEEGNAQQDPRCQFELAKLYKYGKILNRDERAAFELFKEASDKSLPIAKHELGNCYKDEIGTGMNLRAAFKCYYDASILGHSDSLAKLAYLYEMGIYVKQDAERSLQLLYLGCSLNSSDCLIAMAMHYIRGIYFKRDYANAARLLSSASSSNPAALYNLALIYLEPQTKSIEVDVPDAQTVQRLQAAYAKSAADEDAIGLSEMMKWQSEQDLWDATSKKLGARFFVKDLNPPLPLPENLKREGMMLIHQAAEMGLAQAQLYLFNYYTKAGDEKAALRWLANAAFIGDDQARELYLEARTTFSRDGTIAIGQAVIEEEKLYKECHGLMPHSAYYETVVGESIDAELNDDDDDVAPDAESNAVPDDQDDISSDDELDEKALDYDSDGDSDVDHEKYERKLARLAKGDEDARMYYELYKDFERDLGFDTTKSSHYASSASDLRKNLERESNDEDSIDPIQISLLRADKDLSPQELLVKLDSTVKSFESDPEQMRAINESLAKMKADPQLMKRAVEEMKKETGLNVDEIAYSDEEDDPDWEQAVKTPRDLILDEDEEKKYRLSDESDSDVDAAISFDGQKETFKDEDEQLYSATEDEEGEEQAQEEEEQEQEQEEGEEQGEGSGTEYEQSDSDYTEDEDEDEQEEEEEEEEQEQGKLSRLERARLLDKKRKEEERIIRVRELLKK
jgi:TPR repeat protein